LKVHDGFFKKRQHSQASHGSKSISLEDSNNIDNLNEAKMDQRTKDAYAKRHPEDPFINRKKKEKKEKKKEEPKPVVKEDATAM